MHLQDFVHKYRPDIINTIENHFTNRPNIFYSTDVSERLKSFASKGKTLRGIILCLSAEMYGREVNESVFATAAAIEINHSGLLIHDDIIDRDELRRGEKTLFAQYSDEGKRIGLADPKFYGSSVAICVGDIAFFAACQLLSVLPEENLPKLLSYFYKELENVALAEMYEFAVGQKSEELSLEAIEQIYEYKTARYTFSLPLVLGGMLAGISDAEQQLLERLGRDLGIIFQIKDDEIGLLGEEAVIGKPVGSDIRENKKTLIRSYVLEAADSEERKKLDSIFGNGNIGDEEIAYVRQIVEKYNISEKIGNMLSHKAGEVNSQIGILKVDAQYKEVLKEFVRYNLERSY